MLPLLMYWCTAALSLVFAASACAGSPTTVRPSPPATPEVSAPSPARAVVAAATPEAATAGRRVLEAGGNAADAAVAVAFALGVTEPAMSGLGGQLQVLVHPPDGKPLVINGTSVAPRATPLDAKRESLVGRNASTVPTSIKTLAHLFENHGSGRVTWAQTIEPAHRYAESGFEVGAFRADVWKGREKALRDDGGARAMFLDAEGQAPVVGATWQQPAMAKTLARLARGGPDSFYTGDIAQEILEDARANDSWLSKQDLAEIPPRSEEAPLTGTYRGVTVSTQTPPGGGWVVLLALNLLERHSPEDLRGKRREIHMAEALALAHRERRRAPVQNLLHFREETDVRTSKEHAAKLERESIESRHPPSDETGGETTHFSVVDATGFAVSVTASINAMFGAKVAHPTLGFLFNDYMHELRVTSKPHPFRLRPRAAPYSSMSPTILSIDGKPVLVLGSPGSARIISAVVQVVQCWVDEVRDIQQCVGRPRVHADAEGRAFVEDPLPPTERGLVDHQFEVQRAPKRYGGGRLSAYFGGVHAVALEQNAWTGAADPRRDGAVEILETKP